MISSTDIRKDEGLITLFASKLLDDGSYSRFKMSVPEVINPVSGRPHFTGTGDLLTSMLLAWSERY